jgi:hypothetical protein
MSLCKIAIYIETFWELNTEEGVSTEERLGNRDSENITKLKSS